MDCYFPGISADSEYVAFPRALHALGAPIAFVDEADAYQAAEVLNRVTHLDADVSTTDEGFAVVLQGGQDRGDLTDYNLALIIGACRVLESFTCIRKEKSLLAIGDEKAGEIPWQKSIGDRYLQQQRIEAKLDEVLARLGLPATPDIAASIATGAELVANIEAAADKHTRPEPHKPAPERPKRSTPSNPKSSAKRSA